MFDPGYKRTFTDTQLDESMINVPMRDEQHENQATVESKQAQTHNQETEVQQLQQVQQVQQAQVPPQRRKTDIHIRDTSLSSLVKTASKHRDALEDRNKRVQQQKKDHRQRYGF